MSCSLVKPFAILTFAISLNRKIWKHGLSCTRTSVLVRVAKDRLSLSHLMLTVFISFVLIKSFRKTTQRTAVVNEINAEHSSDDKGRGSPSIRNIE